MSRGLGFRTTLSLACLSHRLRTVLGRLRGQVDNAQGDSKMRRQREMQGWPGTRFPEGEGSLTRKSVLQVTARMLPAEVAERMVGGGGHATQRLRSSHTTPSKLRM